MTTSISPRRRQVVISRRVERRRRAPLGHAQRLGDLRLRDAEQPQHVAGGTRSRPPIAARKRLGLARRPPTSAAARAAGRAARRPSGRPSPSGRAARRGPGAVPTGSRTVAPAGTTACLRFGLADRLGVEVRPALRSAARGSPRSALERLVEHHLAALERRRRPRAVRSSAVGPRPPLVTTRSIALAREEAAARPCMSSGRSPTTTMCAMVDAELAQPLGQPRAVAVGDAAGEDLGARDDDARAGAHRAGRPLGRAEQRGGPCGVIDVADAGSTTSGTSRALPLTRSATAAVAERHAEAPASGTSASAAGLTASRCDAARRPRASTRQT